MKTKKIIIYIILIATLLSMVLSACAKSNKLNQIITIQSTELSMSKEKLEESVRIIKSRLTNFDANEFEIKAIHSENKIEITFSEEWKIDEITPLLIQKGNLEFCSTFSRSEVKKFVDKKSDVFAILNPDTLGSQIGSVPEVKMQKLQKIISLLELENKCKFAWSSNSENAIFSLYALNPTPIIKGDDIENAAREKFDNTGNNFYISINLKPDAINSWSNATRENIGKSIAIVLDNKVLAAPMVRSEIKNGKCQITGDFSENEAKRFAILINSELPGSFKIVK